MMFWRFFLHRKRNEVNSFLVKFLFMNFLIHFGVFLWLAIKRRKNYHFVLSLTFLLLTLSFALRMWLPEAELHGHKLFWYFRMSALASSAAALLLIFRQRQKKPAKLTANE